MARRTAAPRRRRAAGRFGPLARRFVLTSLLSGLPAELLTPAARPDGPAPGAPETACSVALDGRDEAGRTILRTIALALHRPGLVVAPLHALERGGARWARLSIEGTIAAGRGGAADVAAVVSLDPPADLAYLHAPGFPACAAPTGHGTAGHSDAPATPAWSSGTAVEIVRERSGYRPGVVGGRVERAVDLPDGRRLILARLLDRAGADPGLVLDAAGVLVGSAAPAPPGSDPSLIAVVLADPAPEPPPTDGTSQAPRSTLASKPSPSFSDTLAGRMSEVLLLAESGRTAEALSRLDAVMSRGIETPPLLLERGALRYASGRLPAAVADFRQAAELDPSSYLARFNLGVALGASGRYEDAVEAFGRARDLAPASARARFELALALRAADRADAARTEWESLAGLDPTLARELGLLLGY